MGSRRVSQVKERQILSAAEVLFTTRRFHEVTMDDVCHQAGVGKGTIYRYFKDKDDLFQRLMTSGAEDLCDVIAAESGPAPFAEQLRRVVRHMRQEMLRKHDLFRLMHSEEMRKIAFSQDTREQWRQRRQAVADAMAAFLQRGVDSGEIRRDIPPKALAGVLLGMLRGLVWHGEALGEGETAADLMTDLFLRGAGASPVSESR